MGKKDTKREAGNPSSTVSPSHITAALHGAMPPLRQVTAGCGGARSIFGGGEGVRTGVLSSGGDVPYHKAGCALLYFIARTPRGAAPSSAWGSAGSFQPARVQNDHSPAVRQNRPPPRLLSLIPDGCLQPRQSAGRLRGHFFSP